MSEPAKKSLDLRNPLAIIGLFIGLSEVGFGVTLAAVAPALQGWVLAAMFTLCMTTLAFFVGAFFTRPHHFYAPSDFRDEANYISLNSRVQSAEQLAATVARKLEAEPLYRYTKLSEAAQTLFVYAYRHLDNKPSSILPPRQIWEHVVQRREELHLDGLESGLNELIALGWLIPYPQPFERTADGEAAFKQVGAFAVQRTVIELVEAAREVFGRPLPEAEPGRAAG